MAETSEGDNLVRNRRVPDGRTAVFGAGLLRLGADEFAFKQAVSRLSHPKADVLWSQDPGASLYAVRGLMLRIVRLGALGVLCLAVWIAVLNQDLGRYRSWVLLVGRLAVSKGQPKLRGVSDLRRLCRPPFCLLSCWACIC